MRPASKKIREWREDPSKFVKDCFGVAPDVWQEEALRAFASRDPIKSRISLQACAGPGKSTVLAWCGWNFLLCYADRGEHPKAAAISITADNLKDNLWAEMSKWRERCPLLVEAFEWTKERIFAKSHPSTWFMSARSFSKSANADEQGRTLSGLHSRFVLYLIDESGDIGPAVLRSAEQGLSNCEFGKILQAGNPTSHDGMLYAAFTHLRNQWTIIRITGDPDDPRRSPRIDKAWASDQIKTYGRDNPWVMSYILGQFPPSSLNTLLGPEEVETAFDRQYKEPDYDYQQKRLGVDVARFGDDKTVIFPRQGLVAFKPVEMRGARSNEIAARVAQAKDKWGSEVEFIDDTGGFGAGVIDSLMQTGFTPQAINFSGKSIDPRYANKRAEMWFTMAEWVKRGGALPRLNDLAKELTAPQYTFQNGKFLLEPKEQIKKRLGFSPDMADALALTFALPDMPASKYGIRAKSYDKLLSEFDPFDDKRT
jgi:phage terminase large subunit